MSRDALMEIYERLLKRFGPQSWWPGQTRFEIIVGAILTQNTSWKNVEKAIDNLKAADCLEPEKLYAIPPEKLAQLIRPAGYFNIKTRRLKSYLLWLFDEYGGDLNGFEEWSPTRLREELLAVKGIGPETADSIVLYAYGKPVFVVDTYTARVLTRHQLIEPGADYHQIQDFFQSNLQPDVDLFNEFHALLVCVGKEFCKPTARCAGCPLESLPHELDPMY